MDSNQLLILATGGSIDKVYGSGSGVVDYSFSFDPAAKDIIREARANISCEIDKLMAKDSLHMDNSDRETIATACRVAPWKRILITHGTDTMIKTAKVIARLKLKKTIVITGAGQPASAKVSDAAFNVGFAVSSALLASPGVYIAMNARLYPWNKCRKNPTTGIFEEI